MKFWLILYHNIPTTIFRYFDIDLVTTQNLWQAKLMSAKHSKAKYVIQLVCCKNSACTSFPQHMFITTLGAIWEMNISWIFHKRGSNINIINMSYCYFKVKVPGVPSNICRYNITFIFCKYVRVFTWIS